MLFQILIKFPATVLGFKSSVFLKNSSSSSDTTFPFTTILRSPDTVSRPMQTWYQESGMMGIFAPTKGLNFLSPVFGSE